MAPDPQTVRALYKKLLRLYPRDFFEQLGESMEQTFIDLYQERARASERRLPGFLLGMFTETATGVLKEHFVRITQGDGMKNFLTHPRSAAILGGAICLPFAILFSFLLLGTEPDLGPLQPLLVTPDPDQPDLLGSLVALGAVLLVLAAFLLNFTPILRTVLAGGRLTTHPANLLLAVATLAAITIVIGGVIVDQYPCWMGVPNCD